MRILYVVAPLFFALAACVYVPVTDKSAAAETACQTHTNVMTVKELREVTGGSTGTETRSDQESVLYRREGGWGGCSGKECAAVLAAIAAVSAGTFIVSGSVVVINNTAHWLEYQGTCDDGFLNTTKQRFLDSFNNPKPGSGT
jgi:hypothetical protein